MLTQKNVKQKKHWQWAGKVEEKKKTLNLYTRELAYFFTFLKVTLYFLPFNILSHLAFDIISSQHFLLFNIMSHSAFITFDIISCQSFLLFTILYCSTFITFVLMSFRHYLPFDVLSLWCFLLFSVFSVDLLSH